MKSKYNKMLEKIKAQPSSRNLSSKIVKASEPIIPTNILNKDYQNEPGSIAEKAQEIDKIKDELADALADFEKIDSKKSNLPSISEVYDKRGKITKIKPTIGGLIGTGIGLGLSAYSPESKAAQITEKLSEADPTSLLFPSELGESEEDIQKMREEQKSEYYKNLMRDIPKNEKTISEEEKEKSPVEELLEGRFVDNSEDQLGEQESPDLEEMDKIVDYQDYLEKRKKIFGYE